MKSEFLQKVAGCWLIVLALVAAGPVQSWAAEAVDSEEEMAIINVSDDSFVYASNTAVEVQKGEDSGSVKEEPIVQPETAKDESAESNTNKETEDVAVSNEGEETEAEITDPFEPVNKWVYVFNDKLYFWFLKPVAIGYTKVVPEIARDGFRNFFSNLRAPVNFANLILQFRFEESFWELFRFSVNLTLGFGGFWDPAAVIFNVKEHRASFKQTLGLYGLGYGPYLNVPFFGPSSVVGLFGLLGDIMMTPQTYLGYFFFNIWESAGASVYERVNETTYRIGEYESMKEAAVEPYDQLKDGYFQNNESELKKVRGKSLIFK